MADGPSGPRGGFGGSGEDWNIVHWWCRHPWRGPLWVEVVIGRGGPGVWPNRRSSRRIDAVHLPRLPNPAIHEWGDGSAEFEGQLAGREVEIIEAKKSLDFAVIGQCIAGIDMFSRAYPRHGRLVPVAVVRGDPDQALRWVCDRRGIVVDATPEDEVQRLRKHGQLPC